MVDSFRLILTTTAIAVVTGVQTLKDDIAGDEITPSSYMKAHAQPATEAEDATDVAKQVYIYC